MASLAAGYTYAGANFEFAVFSDHKLPSIAPGSAIFIVSNLSSVALGGYRVAGVPSWVVQDSTTVIPPGDIPTCSNPVVLNPQSSCVLILNITGPVNSEFALCNGAACTTSGIALNVGGKIP